MTVEEKICAAWLTSAMLPRDVLEALLEQFESTAAIHDAWMSGDALFRSMLPQSVQDVLRQEHNRTQWLFWKKQISEHGLEVLTLKDDAYPARLKLIADPPPILFYQGSLEPLNRHCLSMIGTRRASYRGLQASRKMAAQFAGAGVTVVTGFACGIEEACHEGTLREDAASVAVMACGLDLSYPAQSGSLKYKMLEKGSLFLSEFAPGARPVGWHFPIRNRLISGLGEALIVMEAGKKSGCMITVQHALDQGRDVFAYPGDADAASFAGNHQLLREGAIFFTRAEEVLEDMRWLDISRKEVQNSVCSGEEAEPGGREKLVLTALKRGRLSFDQLSYETGIPAAELMSMLTMLQLRGRVHAMPGKIYQYQE